MNPAPKSELIDFYSFGQGSIFAVFHEDDRLWGQLTGSENSSCKWLRMARCSIRLRLARLAGSSSDDRHPAELVMNQNSHDVRAIRIATSVRHNTATETTSNDSYIGWYELGPTRAVAVTRDGDRIYLQDTGQSKVEVTSDGGDAFSDDNGDIVVFLRDDEGRVIELLHNDPIYGARLAPRITTARAEAIEAEVARRIAQVPDRFRGQTPLPGSKDAVLRGIADMQNGAPNYERMSTALAAKVRRQTAQIQPMLKTLGAVEIDLLSWGGTRWVRHLWSEVRQWFGGGSAAAWGPRQCRRCHFQTRRQRCARCHSRLLG